MPTPPLSEEDKQAALAAFEQYGNKKDAAEALGLNYNTFHHRLRMAQIDPAMQGAMAAIGTKMVPSHAWLKSTKPDEDGLLYSAFLKPAPIERDEIRDELRAVISELPSLGAKDLPPKIDPQPGPMLVLDPADVHIGKLSVATETGCTYNCDIAEHRLVEGCKALLSKGTTNGAKSVLLVIGNDILHVDKPKPETTSGTSQDTDATIYDIFRTAKRAYERVVFEALNSGLPVQIIHVPSNHDWVMGWAVAQAIAARFRDHPNVTATDYAISENHRKYVRFGNNLLCFTHGDGAKVNDLPQIMLQETRSHMADCLFRYVYQHHYHHKMRKALGIRPRDREKDHIAMTVMECGAGEMLGDNVQIEWVRSPSAPDGWHHRNGYLNRQAVEAFLHCPTNGQIMRFTEWF